MATWAGFFKQSDIANREPVRGQIGWQEPIRAQSDPFRLRPLPNDEVFFWSKRIDNSRVVRESDPAARGECLSAMAGAVLLLALAVSIIAPKAAWMMAGYDLQSARAEHQLLLNQNRELEVREASLVSTQRLAGLALAGNLTSPAADQVVHLDSQMSAAMAANGTPSQVVPSQVAPSQIAPAAVSPAAHPQKHQE